VIYGQYTTAKGCIKALCVASCLRTALYRGILAIYPTPRALLLKSTSWCGAWQKLLMWEEGKCSFGSWLKQHWGRLSNNHGRRGIYSTRYTTRLIYPTTSQLTSHVEDRHSTPTWLQEKNVKRLFLSKWSGVLCWLAIPLSVSVPPSIILRLARQQTHALHCIMIINCT
jgi:hypothetical protein